LKIGFALNAQIFFDRSEQAPRIVQYRAQEVKTEDTTRKKKAGGSTPKDTWKEEFGSTIIRKSESRSTDG